MTWHTAAARCPCWSSAARAKGYKSTTFYQHQDTLRLMLEALGVSDLPGHAAGATQMGEFFQ